MRVKIHLDQARPISLNIEQVGEKEFGSKKPVLFILPGGPGADHTSYLRYACLQDVADLFFHDPRGCGQSDRGHHSTYTMENYIEDIEALRTHFKFEKIIVLGKSYGAMCALNYALRYPTNVSKLIVSAGAPTYQFLEVAKENIAKIGTIEQIKVCEKLWQGSFENPQELQHFFEMTNALYSTRARQFPHEFDLTNKSQRFSYPVLNEGFKNKFWHFDCVNALQTLLCPTLILAGSEDWIIDVRYAKLMSKLIPNNQLKIFENASHALEVDVTKEYFETIRQFIYA